MTVGRPRWWLDDPSITTRCYGVFQGGGARGIAYVGALKACKQNGLWFKSVAGASAGAITAALIASGFDPDEVGDLSRELLGSIRYRRKIEAWNVLPGRWRRIRGYSNYDLEERLNTAIARKLHDYSAAFNERVTFGDIYALTGIECTVVALNATIRQPVIFNTTWTPNLSVAGAVVASSAIPIAFQPSYITQDISYTMLDPSSMFHVVVDGGVWANYPEFVFRNRSFREFHALDPMEDDAAILGFALSPSERIHTDDELPSVYTGRWLDHRIVRPEHVVNGEARIVPGFEEVAKPLRMSRLRQSLLALKVTPWWFIGRYILASTIAAVLIFAFLVSAVRVEQAPNGSGLDISTTLHAWHALVLLAVALVPTLLLLRETVRSLRVAGWPAARSMLGAATGVPLWAGHATGDDVVFVPDGGLETTEFDVDSGYAHRVIHYATLSADFQISYYMAKGRTPSKDEYDAFQSVWQEGVARHLSAERSPGEDRAQKESSPDKPT